MSAGKSSKDIWDKLSAVSNLISGALIAGIALLATQLYNYRQLELSKLEALDKFRPLLTSQKQEEREFAYSAFVTLGHEELAIRMISQYQDQAGKVILTGLTQSTRSEVRRSAEKALTELERIWVLDNADPDYQSPPFDDTLTLLDNTGNITKVMRGFNISQTIGNNRPIAASPNGDYVIVAENVTGNLSRYDASGDLVWSTRYTDKDVDMQGVAISSTGYAYVLTSRGTISGHSILRLDPTDGSIKGEVQTGGFDIVVDDDHYAVWLAGADLKKLNLFLESECRLDPIEWAAVSLDFDSTGSIWAAERRHPQVPDSKNRLLKVDGDCKVSRIIELESSPTAVRVDRSDDSLWAVIGGKLHKFTSEGVELLSSEKGVASITVNQRDGTVWAAGFGELLHYAADGGLLLRRGGFSGDQKYIAIP